MPDLPTIAGGPGESVSTPGSTTVTTLTAHATINTKASSWTELIASTLYDTSWVVVQIVPTTAAASYLVDIAVGAGGSEQIIIPDLTIFGLTTTAQVGAVYSFPLRIPRGARVAARCAASVTVATLKIGMILVAAPINAPPSPSRVEAAGITITGSKGKDIDPGGVAHTDSAWTELLAATTLNWRWMCVALTGPNMTLSALFEWLTDVGVGASTAEQVIVSDIHSYGPSGIDSPNCPVVCLPTAIPSGARVAARARCSLTTATDRIITVAAYGAG